MSATGFKGVSRNGLDPYLVGICAASVCAPSLMTRDEVVRNMNEANPTGLDWGWAISSSEHFASGETNPCPCEQDKTRTHYLMEC